VFLAFVFLPFLVLRQYSLNFCSPLLDLLSPDYLNYDSVALHFDFSTSCNLSSVSWRPPSPSGIFLHYSLKGANLPCLFPITPFPGPDRRAPSPDNFSAHRYHGLQMFSLPLPIACYSAWQPFWSTHNRLTCLALLVFCWPGTPDIVGMRFYRNSSFPYLDPNIE